MRTNPSSPPPSHTHTFYQVNSLGWQSTKFWSVGLTKLWVPTKKSIRKSLNKTANFLSPTHNLQMDGKNLDLNQLERSISVKRTKATCQSIITLRAYHLCESYSWMLENAIDIPVAGDHTKQKVKQSQHKAATHICLFIPNVRKYSIERTQRKKGPFQKYKLIKIDDSHCRKMYSNPLQRSQTQNKPHSKISLANKLNANATYSSNQMWFILSLGCHTTYN